MPVSIRITMLAALCSLLTVPAYAAPDNGTLSIQVENDYFSPNNRDRHYSNGLRLDWLPAPSEPGEEGMMERLARSVLSVGPFASAERVGWSLGQSIFTPQNLTATGPLVGDRPYGGWLYAGLTLIKSTAHDPAATTSLSELDTLEIDIGMVGRAALGRQIQRSFHGALFDNQTPNGWANQLKSEPGILISYDHKWRALAQTQFGNLGVDLTPSAGFDLGNVQIDASVGLMMRIGANLPSDYGPPRIRPGLSGSSFFLSDSDTDRKFGWYLFGGIEGRAVARNIFLDGNTFADSLSVSKKTLVADVKAGIAVIVYGARITATQVVRTAEFHGQRNNDVFGAISASFNF